MRKNITQSAGIGADGWRHIDYDWYKRGIPANVILGTDVYLDSAYGFSAFNAAGPEAMTIGENTGCYDRATFVTGMDGRINIGKFTIVNGATIISTNRVAVGDHCMLAWGSVITDTWLDGGGLNRQQRAAILMAIARHPDRALPVFATPKEVILKDNCWIGFDAVILPGVSVGRSAIVGSKSVVQESVPDYAIVAGNPARVIRYQTPDDDLEKRKALFTEFGIQ